MKKLKRIHPLVTAIVTVCLCLAHPASAQTLNRNGKPFPTLSLPGGARGANIPAALGGNMHALADWYGQTDASFQSLCQRDSDSLHTDKNGRLHYVCAAPTALPGSTTTWGNTTTTLTAPYPDSQTFLLHSKPGSTKVIYLCFVGYTTSGTSWNTNFTNGADIVTPAYDIDGDPTTFSSSELANIQVIWQSVAEDYAPFDVDVTTQDPGVEALRMTSTTDNYYGKRVCIGGSSMDWYGAAAGGITYVGSFNWNVDTPAFVFPAQLGSGNPKFVAEACSHEAGHSLGLHHEGLTASSPQGAQVYYTGQGNWAPIMGAGYYCDITQWSRGDYAYANNTEDQLAIINSYLSYRPDTVGSTVATATPLTGSTISAAGIIPTAGKVDIYSFASGAGNISLTAQCAPPTSGNLNLLLSLYDSTGTLVTSVGPSSTAAGITLAATVTAGTYYVSITGVGMGDPLVTGFSNYACLGQYALAGSVVPTTNQSPTAAASATPTTGASPLSVAFSSSGSKDSDGTISAYSWNFGDGSTSTAANPTHLYVATGTYAATLVVYDNYGVPSAPVTVTITAKANVAPVAKASATPTTGAAPLAVAFSSTGSADSDGTVASYSWNFGDGTTSTAASPSHTYTTVGTYAATLTVTDNLGLASAPVSVSITVTKANAAPVAKASATPTTGTVPLAVTFSSTGSADSDGTVASYSWNFGDGTTATTASPSHTYTTAGTYAATLTVTDNLGLASAPVTVTITAKANAAPVAKASATPTTGTAPLAVTFSSTGSTDSDGTVASYSWNFGDGTTATTASPSHTYTTAGTYAATLTVKDNLGLASAPVSVTITVNPAPYVDISALTITKTKGTQGSTATVTATVKDQTGALKSGATVTGTWSGGLVSGSASGKTSTSGTIALTSTATTKTGTITFTVTGITLSGYTYNSSKNAASSVSIAVP